MTLGVGLPAGADRRVAKLMYVLMLSTALGGLSNLAVPAQAQSAPEQPESRSFSIAAQPLGEALTDFGQQSGLQVSVDSAAIRGIRSPGVSGKLPATQALSQLLAGTGFTFRISGNVVTLEPAPRSANAVQLGPVQVEGAAMGTGVRHDPGVTEGTGSYTTRSMRTATRLPMSIAETPQSVTVITSQVLEDRQIDNLVEVVEHTTGLSINRYESNRGSMFSRGFKIENYLIDGVQTSIDEQWSAGEILSSMAIYDRVEILRGSSGLTIGTGNPSAVINMVRKRADSDVLTGSLAVVGGSWSQFGFTADVSTPVTQSGTTRVRFVTDFNTRGSYTDRLESRNYVLFGTVEQDIGENTLLSAGISHQYDLTNRPSWGGIPAWTIDEDEQVVRLDLDRRTNTTADWTFWESRYTNLFARAEHDFGNGWDARASYTRGERKSESKIALFYPRPIDPETGQSFLQFFGMKFPTPGYAGRYFVDNRKDDVNLQVNGGFNLLGFRHDLVFGYDHSKEHFVADGAPGSVSLENTPNVFEFDGNVPIPSFISPPNNYKTHSITQDAFFATARFSLGNPLKLIVGGRVIDYRVDDIKAEANSFRSRGRVVPYAGLVLTPIQGFSAYASYTSIFQPQRYRDAENSMLPPVEGNTYEGGVKAELLEGRLNAAFSIYRMEQRNVGQVEGLVPEDPAFPNGPKRVAYIAVDGIVSTGFEAEVIGEILPQWNVSAGYSQFKARQSGEDESPLSTGINTLIPRRQFNLFSSYELPGVMQGLTVGGGVRWQSETYAHPLAASVAGVPKLEQRPYALVELMARYEVARNWSLQLNVNNLLDKKYFAPTDDGMQVYWQEPRSIRLRAKYMF